MFCFSYNLWGIVIYHFIFHCALSSLLLKNKVLQNKTERAVFVCCVDWTALWISATPIQHFSMSFSTFSTLASPILNWQWKHTTVRREDVLDHSCLWSIYISYWWRTCWFDRLEKTTCLENCPKICVWDWWVYCGKLLP